MRIRKEHESFKHFSDEPLKIITVKQAKTMFREPATVTPILKALEYKH